MAACNALGGDEAHVPVPFVWTEWYGAKVHLLGDCRGDDVTLVGDPAGDRWLALYRSGEALAGARDGRAARPDPEAAPAARPAVRRGAGVRGHLSAAGRASRGPEQGIGRSRRSAPA